MKKLFVIVLAAIGMVSCMNTDEVIEVNNDNAIAFADAFIENSVRAEINNDSLKNFEVWGWMQENTVEAPVFNAMKVSHNGTDWTYSPAQYWVPGFTYTFKALSSNNATHPNWAAAETTDGKLGEVTFTNVDGTEDLIYAAPAAVAAPALGTTAQPVELEFNHQLAKVKFDFTYAPELVEALELSGLTVEAEEMTMMVPSKATIDYSATTPAWILDTTAAQTTLEFAKEGVEKLTIPAGATYEYEITFKVKYYQGTNVIKTIDKTSKVSLAIEKGKAYNFTATLTPENLGLTTIDFETSVEGWDDASAGFEPDKKINYVSNNEELKAAIEGDADKVILLEDIALTATADITRAAEKATPIITITNGKSLTIDLNGKKLSATSTKDSGNYDMILVKGNLTVKNGTIETNHGGQNMGWNAMTTIFDITAGGVLNLEGVTAKNLGGSDMAFVAHLNNWGEVTLNVENSTLESTYIAVRVFNSGPDMNNVTIKNSTLKGKYAFWVHNYTVEDFGTEAKAEAQKALLNLNIYNNGNTFSPDVNGILYGFTNSVKTDAYGITKTVSEDGSEVTLGSIVEDGLIRRGVAGTEGNTTIKKVVVGEGVTTLYDRNFRRFYALETVELPSTLTTIGAAGSGVFQSCTALKNIVIPESVTVLGQGTFSECAALESINIPSGVTRIEADCLRATGLVSVEFHEGVTYFGAQAFRDCENLTKIVIKAPVFTVESNTFLNAAAPYPNYEIFVANSEMKAYLESKLDNHHKTFITVVAPTEVSDADSFEAAVNSGSSIIDATGAVIEGANLNVKGATVIGATFVNAAQHITVDGTFMNCVFEGSEAIRWAYTEAGETVVFENCVIKTDFRGFHFDGMHGNVLFKNCEINGFNAYGGEGTATFEGCTFGCDESSYAGLNIYSNTVLKDCTFNFTSGKTNFIDLEGTGKTLSIFNCTATLDGAAANIQDYIGGSKKADNTILIDGYEPFVEGVGMLNGVYYILNATGWNWMEAQADAFFSGKTIALGKDIDFNNATITPIRFWDPEHPTTFDGKDLTIKNFVINGGNDNNIALFNGTLDVKNLKIDNATVSGRGYVAIVGGNIYGNIDNVHITNSEVTGTYWQVGGFAGQFNSGNITNSSIKNTTITGPSAVGALAGITNENGERTFENCVVEDCVIAQNYSFGGDYDKYYGVATGLINIDNSNVYFTNVTMTNNTIMGAASAVLYGECPASTTVHVN